MYYGFKAEASRISTHVRKERGIGDLEPINCFELVTSLNASLHSVEELGRYGLTTDLINLICYSDNKQDFSATTISSPNGSLVIYNQAHSIQRTNSSLAHEASHIILMHDFSSISDMKMISREFDKEKEDEADWLAGCLLIPEEGMKWAVNRSMSIEEIADHFNVSTQMAQMRYNRTGMKKRNRYRR